MSDTASQQAENQESQNENPQIEFSGDTRILHTLLQKLYAPELKLSGNAHKIILHIAHETIRWHLLEKPFSFSAISASCGVDDRQTKRIIKQLRQMKLINVTTRGKNGCKWTNIIGLNRAYFGDILAIKTRQVISVIQGGKSAPSGVAELPLGSGKITTTPGQNHHPAQGLKPPLQQRSRKLKNYLLKNTLLNSSLSQEIMKYFDEIYFSKIRGPNLEREEKAALKDILVRNQDLTVEEIKKCFEIVSEERSNGRAIGKKFVWMATGLDRILDLAKSELKTVDTITVPTSQGNQNQSPPDVTPKDELKEKMKSILDLEKAFLSNPDSEEIKAHLNQARLRLELDIQRVYPDQITNYYDYEKRRLENLISDIRAWKYSGSEKTNIRCADFFHITKELLTHWYEENKTAVQ